MNIVRGIWCQDFVKKGICFRITKIVPGFWHQNIVKKVDVWGTNIVHGLWCFDDKGFQVCVIYVNSPNIIAT